MARCICGWHLTDPQALAHHLTTPVHANLLRARAAWRQGRNGS